MQKSDFKIYRRGSFIMLAIIISGLLNICLFALQTKAAAAPIQPSKLNFANYDDGNCLTATLPEPTQAINRRSAPMPECCLTQNRNFSAVINTADNKSAPTFTGLMIAPSDNLNPENNSTHYTARLTYPPPEAPALASIVIRE